MEMNGRKVVASFLAGSQSRNLHTPESDKDMKYFVLPTFEDLYTSQVYKGFEISDEVDVEVQDVRRLERLLSNSNLAYLELLFSNEIETFGYREMDYLVSIREDIARMNLQKLYRSSLGMFDAQTKYILKSTSDHTKELIQKYGYNTKKAMMSLHFLRTIIKYHDNGFEHFKTAMTYEGQERDFMLAVKAGKYSYAEFLAFGEDFEERANLTKEDYMAHEFNEETMASLRNFLRQLVKDNM